MPGLLEKDQVGKREDLADLIAVADVKRTPFLSAVNKGRTPINTLFDWQVDNYAAVKTTGTVDGSDVVDYENAVENRARIKNHVQVHRRTAKVSRLAENVSDVAGLGKKKELANSIRKKLVEIGRDMEATYLGGNDAQADDGSVPYLTCALDVWISTAGPATYTVPAAFRTPSAQVNTTATASLTEETDIQGILTAIYDTNGFSGDYTLIAGSVLRRRFTTMTRYLATGTDSFYTTRTFNVDQDSEAIKSSVSIYEGDYGRIKVVSSNFIGGSSVDSDRGYLLDMKRIHLRYNQMPTVERLPDLGGGPRALIESVAGLQVDNPLCLAKFKP